MEKNRLIGSPKRRKTKEIPSFFVKIMFNYESNKTIGELSDAPLQTNLK